MRKHFTNQMAKALVLGMAAISFVTPVNATLIQSTPSGFAILWTAEVQASPKAVWAHLTHPEHWWSKAHSWSGDAANFSMTAVPGGCFCEKMPAGGFIEHARVIRAIPDQMLVLSGALGPLQNEALAGTLTVTITPAREGKSTIKFEYVVGGYSRLSLQKMAPFVDAVIGEQHGRLIKLIAADQSH